MIIVQACDFLFTGDGMHRTHEPSRMLGSLDNVLSIDCQIFHPLFWPLAHMADVLILPLVSGWEFIDIIKLRRAAGKITVFETSDYYHEPQPWNPIALILKNPANREENTRLIAEVDGVQVSSEPLEEFWRSTAKKIQVFPNHLAEIPPLSEIPDRPLTIGFAGSQGHLADWLDLSPILQRWLDDHPETRLAVMSHSLAREFISLPEERSIFRDTAGLKDYYTFLSELDIGLAPLLPSKWNYCRSDVKFLEYSSRGVVGIYSDYSPYNKSVIHRENGFLYNTHEDLLGLLNELSTNRELLKSIRQNAYQYVQKHRMLKDHVARRVDFYRSLGAPDTNLEEFPKIIADQAERDGNYLCFVHSTDTKLVSDALQSKATPQYAQALSELVSRYPRHFIAHQILGKMLNNLGQASTAVTVLSRAIQLNPLSGQAITEIARSHLLLNQPEKALELFLLAVQKAPYSVAAWEYLLQFLRRLKGVNVQQIITELRAAHPLNYGLALNAADLLQDEERIIYLNNIIDSVENDLTPYELKNAGVPIGDAFSRLLANNLSNSSSCALLERATKIFPHTAKLLILYSRALRFQKKYEEAEKLLLDVMKFEEIAHGSQLEAGISNPNSYYPELTLQVVKGRETRALPEAN